MKISQSINSNYNFLKIYPKKLILKIILISFSSLALAQNGVGINTISPLSSFEVNGSVGVKVTFTSSNLTLTNNHHTIVCNNATNAISLTLPAANGSLGRSYQIKKDKSSTGIVTIVGTIDNVTNKLLAQPDEAITIFSDGTEWKTLLGNIAPTRTSWNPVGNSGTSTSVNFLGTIDNQGLNFRTNNANRLSISNTGFVGVGLTDPGARMVIKDTLQIRRTAGVSQLLFTNTNGSGDFRIGGDGGDIYWQGGGGRNLQMGSYWATILGGDRQLATFPAFSSSIGGTGVLVLGQRNTSVPLGVQATSGSQSANLTEWRNSSSTVLSSINANGHLAIGSNTPTSNLQTIGSFAKGLVSITSSLTLTNSHSTVLANNGNTAITITLPAGNICQGRVYEVKKLISSLATVTISGTIDGITNLILNTPGESIILVSDGTNWVSHSRSIGNSATSTWLTSGNAGTNPSTSYIGTLDGQDLVFKTSATERLRILTNGNIGFGVSNPHGALQISNAINNRRIVLWENVDNDHQFFGFGTNNNTLRYQIPDVNAFHSFHAGIDGISSLELMRINGNGTLSLGSTQNLNKFHIYETTGTVATSNNGTLVLEHGNNNGTSSILFKSSVIGSGDFAHISFSDDGSGNGSSSENGLLTIGVQNDLPGSSGVDDIALMPSGYVGINTIAPDAMLSVNGNASKTGGGSWATFSDKRLKKDITNYTDGLDKLLQIKPVTFKYNGKGPYTDTTTEFVGVIAQEIQKIVPYTVDTVFMKMNKSDKEPTSLLSYDPSSLTYLTINAIKDQQVLIEKLQNQIIKLNTENENLKDKQAEDINALRNEFEWVKLHILTNQSTENETTQK